MKIQIYFRCAPPDGDACRFLTHAQEVTQKAGFALISKTNETCAQSCSRR
jgi:hypothetical protein